MRDAEIRQVLALKQVDDFGTPRAADFPAASLGGQQFAAAKLLVAELGKLGEEQSSAAAAVRASAEAKRVARVTMLRIMRAMRSTSKAMEADQPGVSDKFKVPTKNGDEALISAARSFVTVATPLKAAFVQREMPATFLEDLSAAIDEFESAANSLNFHKGKRVGATAGLKDSLRRATKIRQTLDPIVRNKYGNDAAALAAWKSANHVEASPKKKTKAAQPPPPPPSPSK